MIKKSVMMLVVGLFLVSTAGCFAIFAGAAAGAGTAVWLSDKLTQQVNAPYERTVTASENALKAMNLPINKETHQARVAQLRSTYIDGKEVWIDVRKITETTTKVEVRVGAVSPDKEASAAILKKIQENL